MSPPPSNNVNKPPFVVQALGAGVAASIAECITIPLDTVKVLSQVSTGTSKGMLENMRTVSTERGVKALWNGLAPGVMRQMVFASIRIGVYEPVRDLYNPSGGDSTMFQKIAAALTTGAIGISVAQPTDLIKIRLQAEGRRPLGSVPRYTGIVDAFTSIVREEGVARLWTGLGPNMARNAVINAAELATYDQLKQTVTKYDIMGDHVGCHLVCGLGAGFAATVIGSPLDVVKTRLMNAEVDPKTGQKLYSGFFNCVSKIARTERLGGFYKGFWANFSRIGSWNVIMFLAYEQIKLAMTPKSPLQEEE